MQLIFSDQELPTSIVKSIFLAGPSPRSSDQFDWRHLALAYLEKIQWDGTVFIPIPKNKFYGAPEDSGWTYLNQITWECNARQMADNILFWVDRNIDRTRTDLGMPAFTTNIEFGEDLHSGKIEYGRPDSAEKCRYLDNRITELKQTVNPTLENLLDCAVNNLGLGAKRTLGEVNIPLFIWNTEQFQSWYSNLKKAGNRLESAKLLHHVKFSKNFVFCYLLSVNIWVEKEQRFKSNEFVFARKDISTVVAYHKGTHTTKIVLIKEFRSPVNNPEGFVYELPGGSAIKPGINPQVNAQHELEEEIGLMVEDLNRFSPVGDRQLMATVSSHKAQVYKIELTEAEITSLEKQEANNATYGVEEDSEKTYVKIISLDNIFSYHLDYSMLGMIFEALN